jgi:prepilin-type N-terminal cleavage/methylation domain-containing protein
MPQTCSQYRSAPSRPSISGFTLIELLIVVAVIAILTSLAYPSYRDYVTRGRLVDATTALAAFRANMERYYQDNRTYADVSGTILAPCSGSTTAASRTSGGFLISCSAQSATAYTLQATGSGAVNGFRFTIDNLGAQATPASPSGWNTNSCTTIWVLKRAQPCS